jgi:hypothetical protein
MSDLPSGYSRCEVPARLADLAFHFAKPAGWTLADLPPEVPDFAAPQAFAALAIAMAPFAAIVFSVGARPAYDDGTLSEWLQWLAREQGYDPGEIEVEAGLPHRAVGCWALQVSDGTALRMRLLLLEDGGRLVTVNVLAPEELWGSVHDTLRTMLHSFTLARPQGPRALACPAGTQLPESSFTARPPMAAPAAATRSPKPEVEVVRYAEDPVAAVLDLAVQEVSDDKPSRHADVALAGDSRTLRQDDPINQNLLQSGAGFAPRIVAEYPNEKCATVTTSSLMASLRVPFGWHALDDSKRTLVHDGKGGVQIDLSRRGLNGLDHDGFLRSLLPGLRQVWPDVDPRRMRVNGTECLMLIGIVEAGEPLAQVYLLRDAPKDQVLVARVSCKPEDLPRAGNCAEVLLRDAVFFDAIGAEPIWWTEAQRLEQAGYVDTAEKLIRSNIDHLGCYSQIAYLHELRGVRLQAAGDAAGARAAFEASGTWMDHMASGATSGGEGAALSLQRDEHHRRLGLRPYGS